VFLPLTLSWKQDENVGREGALESLFKAEESEREDEKSVESETREMNDAILQQEQNSHEVSKDLLKDTFSPTP